MKKTSNKDTIRNNINIKLFPFYKMISWDLLFFYAIIFLYLVQVKNLSAPQVLLADALYNVSVMLFTIPSGKVVDKIGKKNSVIMACNSYSFQTRLSNITLWWLFLKIIWRKMILISLSGSLKQHYTTGDRNLKVQYEYVLFYISNRSSAFILIKSK